MNRPIGQSGLSAMSTYLIYHDGGIGDSQPQNMPGTEWRSKTLHSLALTDYPTAHLVTS
jgi:hypothetical protein